MTNQFPNDELELKYVKVIISGDQLIVEGIPREEGESGTTESPYFLEELAITGSMTVTERSFGFWAGTGRLTDEDGGFSNGPVEIIVVDGPEDSNIRINDLGMINND
jgi:hypothetical protein